MPDNKKPPIPDKKWVNYYLRGISIFYPDTYYGREEGKTKAVPDSWEVTPEEPISKIVFAENVMKATGKYSIDEAFDVVKKWSSHYDKTAYPKRTTPGEFDLIEQEEILEEKEPDQASQRQKRQ